MDPYTLSNLPQGSKLATYMSHNASANHTEQQQQQLQQQQLQQQQPQEQNLPSPEINEFVPGAYYRTMEMQNEAQSYANVGMQNLMHMSIPRAPQVHQENVGGTTYFYPTSGTAEVGEVQGPSGYPMNTFTPSQVYTGTPNHVATLNSKNTLESTFYMPDVVRAEILQRNQLSFMMNPQMKLLYPDIPVAVESYVDLVPIEPMPLAGTHVIATSYRASHRQTATLYVLRRLHDFRLASSKCSQLIEKWKKIDHPNAVRLREVFSTKVFGDNSLIFVYDFHPGASTVMQKYIIEGNAGENGPAFEQLWTDPDAPRPYTHQKNTLLRAVHGGNMLPEGTIWSLLTQLTAALRVIHLAGLACRKLDPTKVIVCGYRIRLAWSGCDEVANAASGVNLPDVEAAQQDDLNSLGLLILALACKSTRALNPGIAHNYLQLISRAYSADLKNVLVYLLSASPMRNVTDLMPMIGARFYTQIENMERRADVVEDHLAKEMDNARLNKLLIKLSTINERPEFNMDLTWSETGDRYMLKLFRDYLFHSVTADGRPWLDYSHVIYSLNMLDAGIDQKIELMARDEQVILIVTFKELKNCLEQAFNEIYQSSSMFGDCP